MYLSTKTGNCLQLSIAILSLFGNLSGVKHLANSLPANDVDNPDGGIDDGDDYVDDGGDQDSDCDLQAIRP